MHSGAKQGKLDRIQSGGAWNGEEEVERFKQAEKNIFGEEDNYMVLVGLQEEGEMRRSRQAGLWEEEKGVAGRRIETCNG